MNTQTTTQQTGSLEPPTTAQVNGHPVLIRQALPHRGAEAGVVTVGVAVSLSLEDVTAALVAYNASPTELADPDQVRNLVADAVLNMGCLQLDEDRCAAASAAPGSELAAHVALCRDRAAAVFASTSPASRRDRAVAGGALR